MYCTCATSPAVGAGTDLLAQRAAAPAELLGPSGSTCCAAPLHTVAATKGRCTPVQQRGTLVYAPWSSASGGKCTFAAHQKAGMRLLRTDLL